MTMRHQQTSTMASYFAGLRPEDIPADVIAGTRLMLLDTLGCIVAARETEIGPICASLADGLGGGEMGNAYAWGRLANAMDFEEGTPSGSHFGCGAVGAALAIAREDHTTRDIVSSVAVGYEIGGRVADAIGSYFKTDGGKARAFADVWGVATPVVFAAAGAACAGLGHDAIQTEQAFGLAGSSTPVPIGAKWAGEVDLPNTKYCDAGWATLSGQFAARGAMAGSTGLRGIFDGSNGLFAMVAAQNANPDILTADLGERWRIRQVLYKKWPCCRWIHYPLTALTQLMDVHDFAVDEIESVVATVGFAATSKRFANPDPQGFTSFQFSIPHAVAMTLLKVPPGPAWLSSELAAQPAVRRLRERIAVTEHHRSWTFPDFRDTSPGAIRRMSSGIRVTVAGVEHVAEADFAYGDSYSELRWTEADIVAKFRSLVEQQAADRILDALWSLDRSGSAAALLDAFRNARGTSYAPETMLADDSRLAGRRSGIGSRVPA